MTKQEVLERLCALVTTVGELEFDSTLSHDCFCGRIDVDDRYFRVEEEVIDFIVDAVREKLFKGEKDEKI